MRIPLRWPVVGLAIAAFAVVSEAQIAAPDRQSATSLPAREIASESTTGVAKSVDAHMKEVWSYLRQNQFGEARAAAGELLQIAPTNSLGLVANAAASWQSHTDEAAALSYSKRALRFVDELQRPASMQDDEFAQLLRTVRALADHVAGDVYRMRGDYVSARKYLKESVALEPKNGGFAFSAALAYLNGKNQDATTGYWLLARSVTLSRNEPQANEIADYARRSYESAGGTSEHWDRYLASAAATSAPPVVRGTTVIEVSQSNSSAPAAAVEPVQPQVAQQRTPQNERPPDVSHPPQSTQQPEPVLMASAKTVPETRDRTPMKVPDLPPVERREPVPLPQRRPLRVFREGAPISLGIVIEASIASKQNRSSVVYTLSDMVRGLREGDEAFVESYGDKVTFGQDLTWNYELLEQAMDEISPDRGTSMLDAVGFAANHLRRIAKNDNRILFVISDGSENGKQEYSDNAEAAILNSGVRIVCVGMGVTDITNRNRLKELASMTGGQVMFIDDPREFRSAARQIATSFGLHFQE
jgi:hypothetical protein